MSHWEARAENARLSIAASLDVSVLAGLAFGLNGCGFTYLGSSKKPQTGLPGINECWEEVGNDIRTAIEKIEEDEPSCANDTSRATAR